MQKLLKKATKSVADHWNCIMTSTTSAISSPNLKWCPPPTGWYKINSDSTFLDGKAHSGCLIRNSEGSIVTASTKRHACTDPLAAELFTLLDACQLINGFNIRDAIFESGSLNAITSILSPSDSMFWTATVILCKIKKLWHLCYGLNGNSNLCHDVQMPQHTL